MNFELLPNEILLDLFDYFDGVDLLCTFFGTNDRFNYLLYNQYQFYCFQFYSTSKRNFDTICQEHLPLLSDRVYSLELSSYDHTPEQINQFLTYIPSFSQFIRLRSLSLSNISSCQTLIKVVHQCQQLSNLTHLKFHCYSFEKCQVDYQFILEKIWSLPKLRHCHFGIFTSGQQNYCTPTKISSTLESLSMFGYRLKWKQINQWFHFTPSLKHVSIFIISSDADDYLPLILPNLINLDIIIASMSDTSKMISFFQNIPNLRRLNLTLCSTLINGRQFEQIIRNYLPKLKAFELRMKDTLSRNENIEERMNELIDSFQSSFWVDEHRWFVRCVTNDNSIFLHTLSKSFHYSECKIPDFWRSIYPNDNQKSFYNEITSIYYDTFFDQTIPSGIRIPNIDYLCIKLPINDQFYSTVSSLKRLYSLNVSFHNDAFQSQLQTLLHRAPRLHCLHIGQDESLPLQMSLFKYTNESVRQLDLRECKYWFNEEECLTLCHSPLGLQCKVLYIHVQKRQNIIILVKNMINLQALHVECKDEESIEEQCTSVLPNTSSYFYVFFRTSLYVLVLLGNFLLLKHKNIVFPSIQMVNKRSTSKYDLVQWLKDHLPSTCLINKKLDSNNEIQIWIQ